MPSMTDSSTERLADDWVSAKATVIACKQTEPGAVGLSLQGYYPAEYAVTFTYSAGGRSFRGTYRTNSPQECGHDLEILYNAKHPSRNTGTDALSRSWLTMTAFGIAVIAILVLVWFCAKLGWNG
jgi:hypothetical protein